MVRLPAECDSVAWKDLCEGKDHRARQGCKEAIDGKGERRMNESGTEACRRRWVRSFLLVSRLAEPRGNLSLMVSGKCPGAATKVVRCARENRWVRAGCCSNRRTKSATARAP